MIKMLVMDVDGTLTDGYLYYGMNGELFKKFDIKDGWGITKLIQLGIIPVIISGRESEIVRKRFNEIGVNEIHLGAIDKYLLLMKISRKYGIDLNDVAYIGDDENDLIAMRNVGFPYGVKNSIKEIKDISLYTSTKSGGNGAIRDIIEYILRGN